MALGRPAGIASIKLEMARQYLEGIPSEGRADTSECEGEGKGVGVLEERHGAA